MSAYADGHKTIGQTTALIPEAGITDAALQDGQSGNVDFPYAQFKAIATVGEVDAKTGMALTGYPDGQAAYLIDNDTVRVIYQSESYATMGSAPNPETYPWEMANGTKFTGSHIHTIDYDREGFASFMQNDQPAASMVKGSGKLFNRVFNVFGKEVTAPNFDPADLAAKWGNQTRADGTLMQFKSDFKLSEADYFFQSFCGAWYEQANKYGDGIGFADDVWLTAEEWEIGNMFAAGSADTAATMGLASVVVDIANQTAYTAPALGQTGYEKIMPLNSGHKDYVLIVTSGYNHGQEPAPLRVYVGMKHRNVDGSMIDYGTANERDAFLARNGLLYGKLYGMAVETDTLATLVDTVDPKANMLDAYLQDADAPNQFASRYVPTSYQWQGWDSPVAVQDTDMMRWEQETEQPEGHVYFNGDSKVEHPAADPSGQPRYVQNMTNKGAMLGVSFTLDFDSETLPTYLDATVTRMVAAVDGALTLDIGDQGKTVDGDASRHMEADAAKMVAPDGLYWVKASDGDYLIVDEDSGNDFGERKYVLKIDDSLNVESAKLLALAGGKHSSRYQNGVSALGGAFTKPGSAEFSGSWPVTALVAKKSDGSFYSMDELKGEARRKIRAALPIAEHQFIGVVQARSESGGAVEKNGGDAGGQIFQFKMNLN
ncbi:MAG: calcium-binding protein [Gammaproteobacteria bacterium]|nr:calcium-binding protein [Gammaproteobacteria bacterium]